MTWLWIIGILFLLCMVEWIREIVTFRVTHYHVNSRKVEGLKSEKKIVFLSDLHNYTYGRDNQKLLAAIRREKPDLVLVGGDMLIGAKHIQMEHAVELLQAIAKEYPVYCANGNHEQRMKLYPETFGTSYRQYKEAICSAGVTLLENDTAMVQFDDAKMAICGLEIPAMAYAKFRKTFLTVEEITQKVGVARADVYNILLAHNPKYMPIYALWGADMVLSGHYHGGVIRIPGFGGLISPQGCLFPKYSGEHKKIGTCDAIVSKGLGVHTMRIRLWNPAEMLVIHLSSQNQETSYEKSTIN